MKFKKQMLILPAVAVMTLGANFVYANTNTEANQETVETEYQQERKGFVSRVTGEVTSIEKFEYDDVTAYSISMQDEDSRNIIINIGLNTIFLVDGELVDIESIEEGMEITVHYTGSGIISGPLVLDLNEEDLIALENGEDREINVLENGTVRFFASAVVANSEDSFVNVHVDIFNEELVSTDNNIRLVINEDTQIVDINGDAYEYNIENKKLAVIYGASTKSIPAIPINPKIVVLGEVDKLDDTEEVRQPINMLDFLPEFARGNSQNQNNNNDMNNNIDSAINYNDDMMDNQDYNN